MCLLITAFSAFVLYMLRSRTDSTFVNNLFYMCAGASLMWTVDCSFAKVSGENFFDLSADDTFLGITVIIFGSLLCSLVSVVKSVWARA